MTDFAGNKGIQVTGGQFHAGAVSVGDGALAVNQRVSAAGEPESLSELKEQLERLLELLEVRREVIPAADDVLDAARAATEEVGEEKPRRGVVLGLLKSISTGVANVVDVAGVVTPLMRAAGKLMH
jgi:hypothetical protein